MISDPIIRPIIRSDLVLNPSRAHLSFPIGFQFLRVVHSLFLVHSLLQHFDSISFVVYLRSAVLTLSFYSCWNMVSSYCRFCFVYVLPSSTLGSVHVYSHVFHVQLEIEGHFRQNHNNTGRGVHSTLLLSLRNSLHFVYSAFVLQNPVNSFSLDLEHSFFAASSYLSVYLPVFLCHSPAHSLAVSLVHIG